MSYDGGATPTGIDQIVQETDLTWTQAELGLLGSLDKLGMFATSLLWGWVLQRAPAKVLVATGLAINAASTLAFGSVQSKEIMYLSKSAMGVTQGLHAVWCTCWVLTHSPDASRTVWLGLIAVAAGLGSGLGTIVAGFVASSGLPYAFAWQVEAACLTMIWVLMIFCSGEALALDKCQEGDSGDLPMDEEEGPMESDRPFGLFSMRPATVGVALTDLGVLTADVQVRRSVSLSECSQALRFHRRQNVESAFRRGSKATVDRRRFSIGMDSSVPVVLVESDMRQQFLALARNPVYVWTALALSACLFAFSGIQFLWVRLFTEVWGLGKSSAVSGFLVVTGIGGVVGTSLGPKVIDHLGGFGDERSRQKSLKFISSMLFLASCGAISCAVSVLAAALGAPGARGAGGLRGLLCFAWLGLFVVFAAGNATLAGLTGTNASAVDEKMMSLGSGCTLTLQNLLGFAMGPLLPGAMMDTVFSACTREVQLSCGFVVVLAGCMVAQVCTGAALAAMRRQRVALERSNFLRKGNSRLVEVQSDSKWPSHRKISGGSSCRS